jgi:hypothetical protein
MAESIKPDPKEAADIQEAQLAAEGMAKGEEARQKVDVEADYEASKKFDVSDADKSGAGAAAAEAATAPQQKTFPSNEDMSSTTQSTGNPEDYRKMAQDVNPQAENKG